MTRPFVTLRDPPQQQGGAYSFGGGQTPPLGLAKQLSGGGSGMSNFAGGATPLLYAYGIGKGKMLENENPDSPVGMGMLAGLGPSAAQIKEDPVGMGLPMLFGAPWLTPFTGSDKARETEPEWAGLWNKLGL